MKTYFSNKDVLITGSMLRDGNLVVNLAQIISVDIMPRTIFRNKRCLRLIAPGFKHFITTEHDAEIEQMFTAVCLVLKRQAL
jgi:hypothetical protein